MPTFQMCSVVELLCRIAPVSGTQEDKKLGYATLKNSESSICFLSYLKLSSFFFFLRILACILICDSVAVHKLRK